MIKSLLFVAPITQSYQGIIKDQKRDLYQTMTSSSACYEDCLAKDKIFCVEQSNYSEGSCCDPLLETCEEDFRTSISVCSDYANTEDSSHKVWACPSSEDKCGERVVTLPLNGEEQIVTNGQGIEFHDSCNYVLTADSKAAIEGDKIYLTVSRLSRVQGYAFVGRNYDTIEQSYVLKEGMSFSAVYPQRIFISIVSTSQISVMFYIDAYLDAENKASTKESQYANLPLVKSLPDYLTNQEKGAALSTLELILLLLGLILLFFAGVAVYFCCTMKKENAKLNQYLHSKLSEEHFGRNKVSDADVSQAQNLRDITKKEEADGPTKGEIDAILNQLKEMRNDINQQTKDLKEGQEKQEENLRQIIRETPRKPEREEAVELEIKNSTENEEDRRQHYQSYSHQANDGKSEPMMISSMYRTSQDRASKKHDSEEVNQKNSIKKNQKNEFKIRNKSRLQQPQNEVGSFTDGGSKDLEDQELSDEEQYEGVYEKKHNSIVEDL